MFPILPILILLLLGPANAERLAAEGRLPAGLLAVHLAHVAPVRATVVAPIKEPTKTDARPSGPSVDAKIETPSWQASLSRASTLR